MKTTETEQVLELPLKQLDENRELNLRDTNSHDPGIHELADSIKAQGILEPLVVTKTKEAGAYRLVFGFRRAAAAKLAGLTSVPVMIREFTEPEIREAQLVENLQRQDLNPVDEAKALKALLESSDLTQAEVGKRIGKSQPYVANRLRLLGLPEDGQKLVVEGKVSDHVAAEILKLPEGAMTERNRLVRQVVDRVRKDGEISPREFRWDVQAAQRSYTDRVVRLKQIAAAKIPTCPVEDCRKKGRPCSTYDTNVNFTENPFKCSAGHRWSSKTGKVYPAERHQTYTPPAAPTLPEVDPMVLTPLAQDRVAKRLLDAVKKISGVELRWNHGTGAELVLDVDLPAAKDARIPAFEFRDGHKFLELSDTYQPTDAARQKVGEERKALEAWLGTFGRKKKDGSS